ncbi:hypothetical protein FKM82_027684 [Ascaphus truei]
MTFNLFHPARGQHITTGLTVAMTYVVFIIPYKHMTGGCFQSAEGAVAKANITAMDWSQENGPDQYKSKERGRNVDADTMFHSTCSTWRGVLEPVRGCDGRRGYCPGCGHTHRDIYRHTPH